MNVLVTRSYSTVNIFSPSILSQTVRPNDEGTLVADIQSESAE